MCLGIPAKILRIENEMADADINGATVRIGLQLIDNIREGDYVLIHTGYALEKLSEEEALKTLELIRELGNDDPQTSLEI